MAVSEKKRLTALLLCLGLGLLGGHRFYTKRYVTGVFQLLTLGGLGIGAAIDMFFIACGSFKDQKGSVLLKW